MRIVTLFSTTPIKLPPTLRIPDCACKSCSRGVVPLLTTRSTPFTSGARIRLSAKASIGEESRITKPYSALAERIRAPMLWEERSSLGFGGTGPQSRRSSPREPEGRSEERRVGKEGRGGRGG